MKTAEGSFEWHEISTEVNIKTTGYNFLAFAWEALWDDVKLRANTLWSLHSKTRDNQRVRIQRTISRRINWRAQLVVALVEIFLRNYLWFSHFSIFWEILGDFSDFFRKFSIVSENYRIRNLIFKEKRRKFRFLKNSKKSLPFFPNISYFLRTRWDWETKNSRKIAETLDLKNSVKNLIFSVKNFYFIRIQQKWEYDNFEKIWETSHFENSEKNLIFPE